MEKTCRLIVKNLPLSINDSKLKKLFQEYVTINNVDLKEKKNIDNNTNKFAFISVSTTDQNLQTCKPLHTETHIKLLITFEKCLMIL
jgi:RNA recognition motif-containing protein